MSKTGDKGGAGAEAFALDQFQVRVGLFEFGDNRAGGVGGMIVDEEEFEAEMMFYGSGESASDKFGEIPGFVFGRTDDGELHGIDYSAGRVGDPGLEPGTS